jgi:serine/threonine protein kinase
VKCFEAWEESGYLLIRSEICERGNLNEYLVELEKEQETELLMEEQIWKILMEMVFAIKHVHDSGFAHLDIKPSNFFVRQDGTVKLGDFGSAVELANI